MHINEERFWAKVEVGPNCWQWNGTRDGIGYGQFWNGRLMMAHRLAYELKRGEIPSGMEIDHLCRNRLCVNPEHLDPVSHKVNTLRGTSFSAKNAKKTHCKNGHPLAGDNLVPHYLKNGARKCRICHNANTQKSRANRKNATS